MVVIARIRIMLGVNWHGLYLKCEKKAENKKRKSGNPLNMRLSVKFVRFKTIQIQSGNSISFFNVRSTRLLIFVSFLFIFSSTNALDTAPACRCPAEYKYLVGVFYRGTSDISKLLDTR